MQRESNTPASARWLLTCGLLGSLTTFSALARADHTSAPSSTASATLASLHELSGKISANVRDEAKAQPKRSARVDLSRFSNGPRWVPNARGRALARAQALGIGSHEATIKLLRNGAWPALRAAVPAERPATLLWPVPGGHPGRGFGFTRRVKTELRHNGIDIGAPEGAHIRAAEAGLVVYSDNTLDGYGNAVIVLHGGGLMTLYAHNLRNTVQPGWYVERGERIALIGDTGYAWGPHSHFELRDGYRPIDPKRMIRGFHDDEIAGPLAELAGAPKLASATKIETKKVEVEAKVEPETKDTAEGAAKAEPVVEDSTAIALREAQRVLRGETASIDIATLGRTFRTLLFPLKDGKLARGFASKRPAIELTAVEGSGVRAVADGIVLYSGAGLMKAEDNTRSVVLLHADGTCSVYRAELADAVESGTRVLRGQWLGKLVSRSLSYEWRADGAPRDPSSAWAPLEPTEQVASK